MLYGTVKQTLLLDTLAEPGERMDQHQESLPFWEMLMDKIASGRGKQPY